jgi:hypothetical protein
MRFSGAVDHQTFRDDLWKFPIRVTLKQFREANNNFTEELTT